MVTFLSSLTGARMRSAGVDASLGILPEVVDSDKLAARICHCLARANLGGSDAQQETSVLLAGPDFRNNNLQPLRVCGHDDPQILGA